MQIGCIVSADASAVRQWSQREEWKEVIEEDIRLRTDFISLSLLVRMHALSCFLPRKEVSARRRRKQVNGSGEELKSRENLGKKARLRGIQSHLRDDNAHHTRFRGRRGGGRRVIRNRKENTHTCRKRICWEVRNI
jgi:hypothetical protein